VEFKPTDIRVEKLEGNITITQDAKKTVRCDICRHEVLVDDTFQCPKCLKVVGKDHRETKLGWCEECARKYQDVIEKLDKGEVVVGADGKIMTQEDFGNLVAERGRIRTPSGERVATIKENNWYAKWWYQTKPKRYQEEVKAMNDFYPGMELATASQGQKLWRGKLTTWRGNVYDIQLVYPTFFPFEPPKAYVLKPKIEVSRHIYKDGHLCLFRRDDRTWQPRTTAATMVSWVSRWLHCYEVWQDTGEWPGREHDKQVMTTNY